MADILYSWKENYDNSYSKKNKCLTGVEEEYG